MGAFDDLLRLQDQDTLADQLHHRRDTLPERAALAALAAEAATRAAATAEVRARRDELAREQRRIEDEVASVEAKAAAESTTLYSGTVTSPKELQAIQHELESLGRRQRALEDDVIALMEQAEPLDEALVVADAERAALDEQAAELEAALAAGEAVIDAELAVVEAARAEIIPTVGADLLARYQSMRTKLGGVAIAPLVGVVCGGCHLQLAAAEVESIRSQPADAVVLCEECGRMLVR